MSLQPFDKNGEYKKVLNNYTREVQVDGTDVYTAYAVCGTALATPKWRAMKVDENGNKTWADCGRFTQVATDLPALTYGNEVPPILLTRAYNFGGSPNGSNVYADNDSWDEASWTAETDLPDALRGPAATEIGTDVFRFGGWISSAQITASKYNGTAWSAITDMPSPARAFNDAATLDDVAYIGGGYNGTNRFPDFDAWNLTSWSSKTNLPSPARSDFVLQSLDTKIYAIGGAGPGNLADVDVWSGTAWSAGTSISPARQGGSGSAFGGNIYIAYGYLIGDCDSFDGVTWTAQTNGPLPVRDNCAGAAVGTTAYSFCGYNRSPATRLLDNDGIDETGTWASYTNCPGTGRYQTAACST